MLSVMILVLFFCFIIFYSSMHVMMVLLILEFLVLLAAYHLSILYSWFPFVMVVMIGVCLGAYGISAMVCNSQSKNYIYFFFF